jgi:uncharacterized membrane protein YfcA
MTPLAFTGYLLLVSALAGALGSLLGLGGGIIVVPALTLLFKVDIRYAIGASIVSVIATSSGAAATYVRDGLTNLRVAMFLELGTTAGALSGAYLAGLLSGRWLYVIFGAVLALSAVAMVMKGESSLHPLAAADPWADRLRLHGRYFDPALGQEVVYQVAHTRIGLCLMYLAGIVSGLLGIGSGALKVPAMDLAMGLPIKVSSATSNFMIGVTAAASAGVYFARGDIDPFVVAPVCVGILLGAAVGAQILPRLDSRWVRGLFVLVLLWVSFEMLVKGTHG